jgi:hypothetical protein
VAIERMERQELVAISQAPAVVGEEMFLELFSGSGCIALKVKVLDSRPVVIAGSVRHRVWVAVMTVDPLTASNGDVLAASPAAPEIG